jgi:hypothetical protein
MNLNTTISFLPCLVGKGQQTHVAQKKKKKKNLAQNENKLT